MLSTFSTRFFDKLITIILKTLIVISGLFLSPVLLIILSPDNSFFFLLLLRMSCNFCLNVEEQ